jgi:hypothetical protein
MKKTAFGRWLSTFLSEKGVDSDELLEVEGSSGANIMPVGVLVEIMNQAPRREQEGIKTMMVRIDFANGDVRRYLRHLASAAAQ